MVLATQPLAAQADIQYVAHLVYAILPLGLSAVLGQIGPLVLMALELGHEPVLLDLHVLLHKLKTAGTVLKA